MAVIEFDPEISSIDTHKVRQFVRLAANRVQLI